MNVSDVKYLKTPPTAKVVYLLHHPESEHLYVGKSERGLRRPQNHGQPSSVRRYPHLPRTKWILSLRERGLEYEVTVLETCATVEDLCEAERFYIAYFRAIGLQLLNVTDGGDGISGWKHGPEALAKLSAVVQRRMADEGPEATSRRMSKMSRAYWDSPGARERWATARTGRKHSDETKAKMSAAARGKPKSPEHKAATSAAMKEACARPEVKEKRSKAQLAAWEARRRRLEE